MYILKKTLKNKILSLLKWLKKLKAIGLLINTEQ